MNASTSVSVKPTSGKSKSGKKGQKQVQDLEELVSNTEQQRNWRGIVIALLVIVTVLGLIVTAIVLVTPKGADEEEKAKFNFKDFITHKYEPRALHYYMMPGTEKILFKNHNGEVEEFDCLSNESRVIMDNSTFRELDTEQFHFSSDMEYVLLPYYIHSKFRHSTLSKYKIYNVKSKTHVDLIGPRGDEFEYVTWSPTGTSLVCVQYNDIFYLRDIKTDDFQQLTFDGELDQIYNGIPDWVYEEEILSSDNAIWWSPESTYLLYAHFDETEVYRFDMAFYGDMTENYVINRRIPYPKAGTPNPKIKLKIVNLNTNITVVLEPPTELANVDHYFTTVTWQNDATVLISWLNRPQNLSILTICSAVTGKCRRNHRVECTRGWVDIYSPAIFTMDGNNYFLILSQKDGDSGSFKHIAKIDAKTDLVNKHTDGSKIFLTAGLWDVTEIVGYDDELKTIFFIATKMGDPRMRHLYSTSTSKDHPEFRQVRCLSCDIGDYCQYVTAAFTSSGKYYILGCIGPEVPSYSLYSTDEKFLKTLEDNRELKDRMSNMALPIQEYVKIPLSEDEYMWAKLLLPPVLKKDEIITYEILFKVYGSPGSQQVTEKFNIDWEHYLSSVHNVIIAYVDGRGTGGRGDRWLYANYKSLGTTEVEDTLAAGRHFNTLHYVNDQSATIYGKSYGGYLTASILSRGENVFKCGVSVAPVTDWRYYDSVYTERHMGMPTAEDNLDAYNFANISRYAANFRSTKFMLIHGTGDDNVHFQNSAQLIKALTESNVYFQSQIYPDETHFLNSGNTRTHLYNSMEEFLLNCYGKPRKKIEVTEEVDKDDEEIEE